MKKTPLMYSLLALLVGLVGGWTMAPRAQEDDGALTTVQPKKRSKGVRRPSDAQAGDAATIRSIAAVRHPIDRLRATVEFALSIPEDQLLGWWEEKRFKSGDGRLDQLFRDLIADRLATHDPVAVMKGKRSNEFLAFWIRLDPLAVEAHLMKLEDAETKLQLLGSVFEALARTDPAAALALVGRMHSIDPEKSRAAFRAFLVLSRTERGKLMAAAGQWPDAWRREAHQMIAPIWLQDDAAGALKWLRDREDGMELFLHSLDQWRGTKMGLFEIRNDIPREWFLAALTEHAEHLVRSDPLNWLKTGAEDLGLGEKEFTELRRAAQRVLTFEHREELIAILDGFPRNEQMAMVRIVVREWSRNSGEDVEDWIATLPDEELRERARSAIRGKSQQEMLVPLEPMQAGELFEVLGAGEDPNAKVGRRYWSAEEIAGATEAFRGLPEDERARVSQAVIERRGWSAPGWLTNEVFRDELHRGGGAFEEAGNRNERMRKLCDYAVEAGRRTPTEAAAWAAGLAEGEGRQWALRNVAIGWADQSPGAVRRWAETLERQEDRTAVLEMLE